MNSLEQFLLDHDIDETAALNELQSAGVISDCCVWAKDAAYVDCDAAVRHLRNWIMSRASGD